MGVLYWVVDFGLTLAREGGLGHLGEMAAPEPSYLEVSGRPGRPDIPYEVSWRGV